MRVTPISLFDKAVFILMEIEELVHFPASMSENEAAFVFIIEGHCTNFTEYGNFELKAGQAILAKSGNGLFKTYLYNESQRFSAITIKFHKDVFEKIFRHEPAPFFKQSKSPSSVNRVKVVPERIMLNYLQSIRTYLEMEQSIPEELLIIKLKEIISILLNTDGAPEINQIMLSLFDKRKYEFEEIVKSHILSPISILELAGLTNRSLSSFKKEFKNIFNDSPGNYIIQKRIDLVADRLISSNESISNIAFDCQFNSLAHMSRVFKAKYGQSPKDYRRSTVDNR